ncbi:MAG: restriction endonuclease subunit S [Candidatus Thiodiazotropha endolucinida]|nr:restriction endonuclease subunit S [Candidatus Thiodiazotropha taylori]MCG8095023.1 restriction endonuclease subunit S [Candidatus Thiodiazotropha endolucinida]MCG8044214.1 restriction endonuclease subunit S [Candidatus Thiodiazotropha taylori]MCG8059183.1 restriction endonuclease subunit S [Candidatus Thiodiazotropha taylori]MCG8064736.1 restriction endonuclease subunit S [Candidatus Thiodiazotropha taylori]
MSLFQDVELGNVMKNDCSGASIKRDEFTQTGIRVVPKKAISENIKLDEATFSHTSEEFFKKKQNAKVGKNFCVTTLRNLNPDGSTLGLVCENLANDELLLAQGLFAFELNDDIDAKYICYVSRTNAFRDAIQKIKVGSTQVHIRAREYKQITIPLPPLPIQKQIAALLEKADTLRSQCKQMEQELNQLAQSVFLEMFGDPVTNPKGWKKVVVGDVISEIKDGPHVSPQYADEGIPILSSKYPPAKPGALVVNRSKRSVKRSLLAP